MKINWKVRFSKKNITFILRFLGALIIPILAYMGMTVQDFTAWPILLDAFIQFVSNPFLVGLTIINAINIIPDPTTDGLLDSDQAMKYSYPKKDVNGKW